MKRLLSLLVVLTLVLTLASCKSSPPEPQNDTAREAAVDDLMGTVTATSDEEAAPAFKGLALKQKDLLDTEVESWAILEFNEGQFVMMEENTSAEISELSEDIKRSKTSLEGGKLWVFISNQLSGDESFEIRTPTCALNVRGTVFSITCDSEGGGRLVVYEGVVNLQAGDENYDVTNGAVEIIAKNGVLQGVNLVDLDDADAAPFYINGTTGPGGALGVLRERLPRLTWDEEHPPIFGPWAEVVNDDPDNAAEDEVNATATAADGAESLNGARTATPGQSPTTTTTPRTEEPPTSTTPTQSTTPTTTSTPTGQGPATTTTTTTTTKTTTTTTPTPEPTRAGATTAAPVITMAQNEYKVAAGSSLNASYTLTGSESATIEVSAPSALGLKVNASAKTITGSSLPTGSYQVSVKATNSAGSSSASFSLIVGDTTPPAVKEPAPVAAEAPKVIFSSDAYSVELGSPLTLSYSLTGSDPIQVNMAVSSVTGGSVAGFNLNTGAKTISVGPDASVGGYTIMLTATNSAGSAAAKAAVNIAAPPGKDPTYGVSTEPEPEPEPAPEKGLRPGSGKDLKGDLPIIPVK